MRHDYLVGIGPLAAGIGIVIVLIVAVWVGIRVKAKELPPSQKRQPRSGAWETEQEYEQGEASAPDHGPGHQDSRPTHQEPHRRKPMEVPQDGVRRLPYDFGNFGYEETDEEAAPPKWTPGQSGSWGTG
ncbi:hypothetical protein ACZ90_33925 [Streptomyces albus subsp. albus]|nr:hypothetical protein ACZ90_33925 [Streptomyces albus subsp. albus]